MASPAAAAAGEQPFTFFNAVTPGYFEALGIPVKAGADFDWRDWGSGKRLALVNEVLTAAYFDGAAPLDRMVGQGTADAHRHRESSGSSATPDTTTCEARFRRRRS